jgi:hypothetical protein
LEKENETDETLLALAENINVEALEAEESEDKGMPQGQGHEESRWRLSPQRATSRDLRRLENLGRGSAFFIRKKQTAITQGPRPGQSAVTRGQGPLQHGNCPRRMLILPVSPLGVRWRRRIGVCLSSAIPVP